jgi:hypothetical protein
MRLDKITMALAALALATALWSATHPRGTDSVGAGAAGQINNSTNAAGTEQRLKKLEVSQTGVGTIMLEVQMHFAKLHFAAEARNWDLAAFERGEIEELIEKVAVLRPAENNVNISNVVNVFKETPLTELKDAIDVKDRALFHDAYLHTMATCNSCHQATGRPFISIVVPTNSPVANQRWTAQ